MPTALMSMALSLCLSTSAVAKLPAPTAEASAKAAEASVKSAWSSKVAAFKLCEVENRLAKRFGNPSAATSGGGSGVDIGTCADPGPFEAVAAKGKALEAAGAHSPAGLATVPPVEQSPDAKAGDSKAGESKAEDAKPQDAKPQDGTSQSQSQSAAPATK